MTKVNRFLTWTTMVSGILFPSLQTLTAQEPHAGSGSAAIAADATAPKVPRFSIDYMDKSVQPGVDFYHYADGTWLKNNPVPPDKSRWGGFAELQERNWFLIH